MNSMFTPATHIGTSDTDNTRSKNPDKPERTCLAPDDHFQPTAKEWRLIFNSISDCVSIHDADFRLVAVNRSFIELFGSGEEALLGRHCFKLFHCSDEPWADCPHKKALETGRPASGEINLIHLDRVLEVRAYPLYDQGKRLDRCLHIARDITATKKAEAERNRLVTELSEALANVKTLSGFLPICSTCKKIRNDWGFWEQLEKYISDHSDAEFSHGFCPTCYDQQLREIDNILPDHQAKNRILK